MNRIGIYIALLAVLGSLFIWYVWGMEGESPAQEEVATTTTATSTNEESLPWNEINYTNAGPVNIRIDTPKPGESVPRTFTVSGAARGGWYFEANFPIAVYTKNGELLLESPVQAQGEWMTSDYVPFTVDLTIPGTYTGPALVVLRNDNPSGMPEQARAARLPIYIK